MKNILEEIKSGQFAQEWQSAYKKENKASFSKYMKELEDHQIEMVGRDIRKMMWPSRTET
jgi:ketol-acid reductoisomerase